MSNFNFLAEIDNLREEIDNLRTENKNLLKELQYKYEEMDLKGFLFMGENLEYWKNLKAENERLENLYKFSDIANRAENEKRVQYEIALVEVREKGVVR